VGIALRGIMIRNKILQTISGYIAKSPILSPVKCLHQPSAIFGLAHGFSSFIAGEKGQFIVLHSGLVPAAMPVRLVEIKH